MIIKEVQAKTILSRVSQPDRFFGLRYNLNLYRGCQHQCIYCDSRSACYQIENFNHEVLVKVNALDILEQELTRKRVKGTIGTGSMNDPYMPLEAERKLTRGALELIARYGFGVHVITKSCLVLRDIPLLQKIGEKYAAVTFTITTPDDDLARRLEPGAPVSSQRLQTMQSLAENGIYTGVTLMPVLPFLEDNPAQIVEIVHRAAEAGARYIIPGFSVTLRDRQRDHFYHELDGGFPGMRQRYEKTYGQRYGCRPLNYNQISQVFHQACQAVGLAVGITPEHHIHSEQLQLGL